MNFENKKTNLFLYLSFIQLIHSDARNDSSQEQHHHHSQPNANSALMLVRFLELFRKSSCWNCLLC